MSVQQPPGRAALLRQRPVWPTLFAPAARRRARHFDLQDRVQGRRFANDSDQGELAPSHPTRRIRQALNRTGPDECAKDKPSPTASAPPLR